MEDKLQKKRDEAAFRLRELINKAKAEGRGLSAEEKTIHQNCVAEINDVDDLRKLISEAEKLDKAEQFEQRTVEITKKGVVDKDPDIVAFDRFLRYGDTTGMEKRAMSTTDGATGGYLVPERLATQLREYMATDNIIRQLATVIQWNGDGAFPVVTDFGTSYLVTAGNPVTETTPTIAEKTVKGYQFMYAVDVPVALINKSAYNLEAAILGWMGKSLSQKQEDYFADGDGSGEPIGLVDAATEGTHSAIHTALGGDDIIAWYHDVPFKHRARSTWLMADSSIKLIRQITNAVTTSGALNYIWAPGLGGNPDTLMGRPVYPSAGFAAFAAGEEIGVFGDISQYMIVDFGAPTMIRDPYTRAKFNEVSFIGCYITDTALPVAEAVRTLLIDAS